MTDYVQGFHRRQQLLMPDTVDDYVSADNPARFIAAFVDNLDLTAMGFTHTELKETGRPPYDPADLLKLYLYGYLNQVRTSRKLERECTRNLEVMWLIGKLAPDFKTIADFRKDNVDCIRAVFRELHCLCTDLGLLQGDLVGIDGTKFKAVNSNDRSLNEEKLQEKLKRIDERVARYLEELDANDKKEEEGEQPLPARVKDLQKNIEKLKEKKTFYEGLRTRMETTGEKEISLTDPDCRTMKNNGKLESCYNGRIAVDSVNKLIVAYDVDNLSSDRKSLAQMSVRAKEALGVEKLEVTADKGFHSAQELHRCFEKGITPYVPKPDHKKGAVERHRLSPEFNGSKFAYDASTDSYLCPAGKRLTFYSESHYNRPTNPERENVRLYTTTECLTCPHYFNGCTSTEGGRRIGRTEYAEDVEKADALYGTVEGRAKVNLRKTLVEHPFGTIKRAFNQGYLLLKGLRKVEGEVGLTFITYNMRRIINIVGTESLVARLTPA